MTLYTVHEDPDAGGETAADRVVFVKDGFSWTALFFAVPWILWHRLWWVLLGYLAAAVLVPLVMSPLGPGHPAIVYVTLAGSVFFALIANDLRRWTLERRGYRLAGVVEGRRLEEAELRFFSDWVTPMPGRAPTILPPRPPARPIGMFPERAP